MTVYANASSDAARAALKRIVDEIVEALEKGEIPWVKPWDADRLVSTNGGLPFNGSTGKAYRGINILLLMTASSTCPEWWTKKQAEAKGGKLKRDAIGMPILYFGMSNTEKLVEIDAEDDSWRKFWEYDETPGIDEVKGSRTQSTGEKSRTYSEAPFIGSSIVYNRMEIDGLPPSKYLKLIKGKAIQKGLRHPVAEQVISASGAVIHHGGNRAFFSPSTDSVTVPEFKDFHNPEGYYGTLFHELTHWTGGEKRLKRTFGRQFGDDLYAFEELVAELGASFVASALGIAGQVDPNNIAYIQSWIKKFKSDPKTLMKASALAMQAFDYLKVPHFAVDAAPVPDGPSAGTVKANRPKLIPPYRGRK